jgi:hypothetical protein
MQNDLDIETEAETPEIEQESIQVPSLLKDYDVIGFSVENGIA